MTGEQQPPSFRPERRPPRPSTDGARAVGPPPPPWRPGGNRRTRGEAAASPPADRPEAGEDASLAPPAAHRRPAAPSYPPRGERFPRPREASPHPAPAPRRRRRGSLRVFAGVVAVVLVLLIAWPVGLLIWANGRLQHTSALSGEPGTPGTTYLIAGSDSRADGRITGPTDSERADTTMLLHVPEQGPTALVSLPRDTLAEVPGHGTNKLNTAYAAGGATLLVQTVEGLTGVTVDHYVEIGMGGVQDVVDAVGGVELCLDYDVSDERSDLEWAAGCHHTDGAQALAFARMRYADPTGDIGRTERQRQLVSALTEKVTTPAMLLNPAAHVRLGKTGTNALLVDEDSNILDLGRMALAFRTVTGADGLVGTPPIADNDYRPGGVGSTVLLDEARAPEFFDNLLHGKLTAEDLGGE